MPTAELLMLAAVIKGHIPTENLKPALAKGNQFSPLTDWTGAMGLRSRSQSQIKSV